MFPHKNVTEIGNECYKSIKKMIAPSPDGEGAG